MSYLHAIISTFLRETVDHIIEDVNSRSLRDYVLPRNTHYDAQPVEPGTPPLQEISRAELGALWSDMFRESLLSAFDEILEFAETVDDRGRRAEGTLTKEQFSQLQQYPHQKNSTQDDTCTICLEKYQDGVLCTRLKCAHAFHESCIRQWLCERKSSCPTCRSSPI